MTISVTLSLRGKDIYLNTEKALTKGGFNNCLPALLKNHQYEFKPLGGVIDSENAPENAQKVKLCGIKTFFWNDSALNVENEEIGIPDGHLVLGYVIDNRYFIAINRNTDCPIHWNPAQKLG